ncbi:NUC153 and WD40 repeat-containing nucleolar rRNA processing-related protein [Flagelloscypha sp. PMI_526]|nr:NUC153 and WD40 repeat-containing nucleolar rRNA processing-related protein [Flagelloscypha sp. PMI_526]
MRKTWTLLYILSDDWTKSIHLQTDRSLELHTQGGFHYRTRIPRFGRSIAYHFPSCDAYVAATGNEVYRLNLDQGRFMTPLTIQDDDHDILGVNCVNINPAHQLLALGIDGSGLVQFWDTRSRTSVGTLHLPDNQLLPISNFDASLSVTALASRHDGLTYAVGSSTGHTLLYDIRYGLPIKTLSWIEGGSRMAANGLLLSADKKVIKIWDRDTPGSNFVSITPATDLNDVHHVPESGVLLTANEGIQMNTYFIPQLGPAPKWSSFLENITEEMEDQTTRSAYQDFKFVEKKELSTLGLDHLVGTPALKPYMHGYFISLKLYDTARLIANPFVYAEHHEKLVKAKMDKEAGTRIRSTAKAQSGVKVNKALAEKILREEEKSRKKEERKLEMERQEEQSNKTTLLHDPRFAQVFEDPDFAIDAESREYALLNPSSVAQKKKTAVEEEDDESDIPSSSDGLGRSDDEDDSQNESDSSDDGVLTKFDPRTRPGQRNTRADEAYARTKAQNRRANSVNLRQARNRRDPNSTFGQRRSSSSHGTSNRRDREDVDMEISWTPSGSSDPLAEGSRTKKQKKGGSSRTGMFLEKGSDIKETLDLSESERKGRTQRRKGVRSGSKNAFRRING